jgi:Ca2+-binding RTX toxin-like protein
VTGGTGTNVLNGDAGDDTMFDSGQGSTIVGGAGIDKLTLDRSTVASNMAVNFVGGAALFGRRRRHDQRLSGRAAQHDDRHGRRQHQRQGHVVAGSTFIDGGLGVDSATVDFSARNGCGCRQLCGNGSISDGTTSGVAVQSRASHLHRRRGNDTLSAIPATTR